MVKPFFFIWGKLLQKNRCMKYSTKEIMNLYDEDISKLANDIDNFNFMNDPY